MKPGDVIGSWVVDRTLGHGGMGTVFLCHRQDDTSDLAAVKTFPAWSTDDDGFQRFEREIEVLRRLRHPGIVPLKDPPHADGRDAASGRYWLAMAFVDGPTLELRAERGPLPAGYAAAQFLVLADALAYAHRQGVVHRDIKPGNIVLGRDGTRLVDFGIALQEERTRLTKEGMFAGTLAYMAPEIVVEEHLRPDPVLGDIYALGVVLHEALTGTRAYHHGDGLSDRQRQLRILRAKLDTDCLDPGPGHPEPLREAVRRLTEPDPAKRLRDFGALAELLRQVPPEDDHDLDTLDDAETDHGTVVPPRRDPPRPTRRAPRPPVPTDENPDLFEDDGEDDEDLMWLRPAAPPTRAGVSPVPERAVPQPRANDWIEARRATRATQAVPAPSTRPTPPAPAPGSSDDSEPDRRPAVAGWVAVGTLLTLAAGILLLFALSITPRTDPAPPPVEVAAVPAPTPEPPAVQPEPAVVPDPAPAPIAAPPRKAVSKPRYTKRVTFSARSGSAQVRVDGRDRGTTPVTLELTAGDHKVEMIAPDGTVTSPISVGMDKADEFQLDPSRRRVTPIFH